jgi:hypothetical protein
MKFRVFWDVASCSHVEVYFNVTTWRYIPEKTKLPVIISSTDLHPRHF